MKNRLILISVMLLLSLGTYSQTLHLNNSNDARSLSLGSVSASNEANAFSIFNNIAATASSSKTMGVGMNYGKWQPSLTKSTNMAFGAYYNFAKDFSIGLGYRYEMLPKQDLISNEGITDGSFRPQGMSIDLGVAYRVWKNLSLGANLRHSRVDIHKLQERAFSADVHVHYQCERISAGLTVNNITEENDMIINPLNVKIATQGSFLPKANPHQLDMHLQLGYVAPELYRSVIAGAGLEYSYSSNYFARVGYSYSDEKKYMPSNLSLGLGVNLCSIELNAAYLVETQKTEISRGNSFVVGLAWSFTGKK